MKHLVILTVFFCVLVACANNTAATSTASVNVSDTVPTPTDTIPAKADNDTILVLGVGDIMMGTNYPSASYLPAGNDCKPLWQYVNDIIRSADVSFGNLEGAFSDNAPAVKTCADPSVCYVFRTPEAYFQCIVDAGFDLLSLANNHSGDLGQAGRDNTIKLLNNAKLTYAGLTNCPKGIFEKDGIKYGFCAFSPNSGCTDLRDMAAAKKIVEELAAETDIVIVSFHGGAEGRAMQHVTRKTEMFYGENRGNVYEFAHTLIDAGADVVFGHGPHVTRAIDVYKDRFIIYSMGNFCTYGRMSLTGESGVAPIMKVFIDKTGKFLKGEIVPIYQVDGYGPQIDPQHRVTKILQSLTKQDFPELDISISDDGIVLPPTKK